MKIQVGWKSEFDLHSCSLCCICTQFVLKCWCYWFSRIRHVNYNVADEYWTVLSIEPPVLFWYVHEFQHVFIIALLSKMFMMANISQANHIYDFYLITTYFVQIKSILNWNGIILVSLLGALICNFSFHLIFIDLVTFCYKVGRLIIEQNNIEIN